MSIPTPHINAKAGEIAKTVLMPGDPLRAKFIAETFLTDPKLVNNVRGVQGHTGTWKGVPVTVMASGMGIPSISIYSWELFHYYDVDNIIRIGSAGALSDELDVMDIVIGQGACTNSVLPSTFGTPGAYAPIADYELMEKAVEAAETHGRARHRDGGGGAVCQRGLCEKACAVHLHDLRPSVQGAVSLGRGAPDFLHPDDGNCSRHRRKDGRNEMK